MCPLCGTQHPADGACPDQPEGSRVGQIVAGKYRVTRLIAEGGMGVVYEGWHVDIERPFALKFVHKALAESPEWMERFRREAAAAGRLMSDHVAAVLDYGLAPDGAPYLVMEYLVGQTLGERLEQQGRLPIEEAVEILAQACRGMGVAHRAGIVHRDLKPDNLFISRTDRGDLRVKVLDFGIAKVSRSPVLRATQTGQIMGTPAYMSPEQARGEPDLDERTDVYSLGVVAYEALTGQTLFDGESYNSVLFQILHRDVPPLSEFRPTVSESLAAVIDRAMDRDPRRRFADAQALGEEFERCLRAGLCVRFTSEHGPAVSAEREPGGKTTIGSLVVSETELAVPARAPRRVLPWVLSAAILGGLALGFWSHRTAQPGGVGAVMSRANESGAPSPPAPSSAAPPAAPAGAAEGTPRPSPERLSPPAGVASASAPSAGRRPPAAGQPRTAPSPEMAAGPLAGGTSPAAPPISPPASRGAAVKTLPGPLDVASGLPPGPGEAPVAAGETARLTREVGMLSVHSEQGGSLIIDGKPMGALPRLGMVLPPGRHELVFLHPKFGRSSVQVEIRPGQSTTLGANWPQARAPAADPCSPRWFINRLGERELKPECKHLTQPDL